MTDNFNKILFYHLIYWIKCVFSHGRSMSHEKALYAARFYVCYYCQWPGDIFIKIFIIFIINDFFIVNNLIYSIMFKDRF